MEWRAIYIFKYCSTLKSLLLFFHNYVVTCGTSAFDVSMYAWTWKTLAVGGFKRYLRKVVFFKSPFSLNPNVPPQFNSCVSWQICYALNITINLGLFFILWAFLHDLQVTRKHDVHCHCKTYVALFSTHLTEISTWILNDCTKTNEKFYLRSTQCIQGRKWKKICQVGSNKHENFTWFTM